MPLAGWGRIFTTEVTIMGSHVPIELLEWGRTFSDFRGKTVHSYLRLANVPECLYCR